MIKKKPCDSCKENPLEFYSNITRIIYIVWLNSYYLSSNKADPAALRTMPDPTSYRPQTQPFSKVDWRSTSRVNAYTLKSVYEDAVLQLKALKDDGNLSQTDFGMITGLNQPPDVLALIDDKMRYTKSDSNKKQTLFQIVGPSLLRLQRFCNAIDVLAQSSPQMLGLNLVGLIWGSLKLMIVVS